MYSATVFKWLRASSAFAIGGQSSGLGFKQRQNHRGAPALLRSAPASQNLCCVAAVTPPRAAPGLPAPGAGVPQATRWLRLLALTSRSCLGLLVQISVLASPTPECWVSLRNRECIFLPADSKMHIYAPERTVFFSSCASKSLPSIDTTTPLIPDQCYECQLYLWLWMNLPALTAKEINYLGTPGLIFRFSLANRRQYQDLS